MECVVGERPIPRPRWHSVFNRAFVFFQDAYFATERVRLRRARARWKKGRDMSRDVPDVSMIIATYNRSRILVERTLPRILEQTHENFEVLVIGDRCIDDTASRIKELPDPRIRFYDLPRRGRYPRDDESRWHVQGSVPRNYGLRVARGNWISYISDDDILYPDYFTELLETANSGEYELVSCNYSYEEDGVVYVQEFPSDVGPYGGMPTWLYASYLRMFKWNRHSWRRTWNRPCDMDLLTRMLNAGVRAGNVSKTLVHIPAVAGTRYRGYKGFLAANIVQ